MDRGAALPYTPHAARAGGKKGKERKSRLSARLPTRYISLRARRTYSHLTIREGKRGGKKELASFSFALHRCKRRIRFVRSVPPATLRGRGGRRKKKRKEKGIELEAFLDSHSEQH